MPDGWHVCLLHAEYPIPCAHVPVAAFTVTVTDIACAHASVVAVHPTLSTTDPSTSRQHGTFTCASELAVPLAAHHVPVSTSILLHAR